MLADVCRSMNNTAPSHKFLDNVQSWHHDLAANIFPSSPLNQSRNTWYFIKIYLVLTG